MKADEVYFENLPPVPPRRPRPGLGKWAAVAEMLRSRPKEWAVVATCPTAASATARASELRRGQRPGFIPGDFEAKARTVVDEFRVYARYVGAAQ